MLGVRELLWVLFKLINFPIILDMCYRDNEQFEFFL